ncbi:hypothetical protein RhiJN_25806 [Ceratobasidium sp. AG-Ba]|nr:hypothetical protein RhiJN_25806 [Ceratobasidium sp. AG-Ba]
MVTPSIWREVPDFNIIFKITKNAEAEDNNVSLNCFADADATTWDRFHTYATHVKVLYVLNTRMLYPRLSNLDHEVPLLPNLITIHVGESPSSDIDCWVLHDLLQLFCGPSCVNIDIKGYIVETRSEMGTLINLEQVLNATLPAAQLRSLHLEVWLHPMEPERPSLVAWLSDAKSLSEMTLDASFLSSDIFKAAGRLPKLRKLAITYRTSFTPCNGTWDKLFIDMATDLFGSLQTLEIVVGPDIINANDMICNLSALHNLSSLIMILDFDTCEDGDLGSLVANIRDHIPNLRSLELKDGDENLDNIISPSELQPLFGLKLERLSLPHCRIQSEERSINSGLAEIVETAAAWRSSLTHFIMPRGRFTLNDLDTFTRLEALSFLQISFDVEFDEHTESDASWTSGSSPFDSAIRATIEKVPSSLVRGQSPCKNKQEVSVCDREDPRKSDFHSRPNITLRTPLFLGEADDEDLDNWADMLSCALLERWNRVALELDIDEEYPEEEDLIAFHAIARKLSSIWFAKQQRM